METEFNCHFCDVCDGYGCVGQMPGMGGPNASRNFILNCAAWKSVGKGPFEPEEIEVRLAPMTGAVENVGYFDEKQFYFDLVASCVESGIKITIGDGTPDFKLFWGIEAVEFYQKKNPSLKAGVFIKPYPDEKIFERYERAMGIMEFGGIDIDSYNIITMRNLVHLEKKSASDLIALKKFLSSKGIPFAVKGVFNSEDIEVMEEVKPDIVCISNHGGRVDVRQGSTAEFLKENYRRLKNCCGRLWVDGGIRTMEDVRTASTFGADGVMMGRPFATALCQKKSFSEVLK
ncbi:FMN-dependent dehydrogenase [Treponema rectale]|uniref:FMN-dependent dehydrogenase n=1 Tax=Treponema rectale TaxID=744512 RepID=A0A840SD11_9SPIR|nr:alpha-hydroxy-acid oxidizing protein [Treponema rectale]MBB5217806.1 isopentenyl diphosphate isomerase/L-lactate dehydrogenase-like FMN-dependent dehydrogenase [Treponema rectale]QOS40467.1 FMN-dependent dehydrogenase [Treponema rectale]